MKADAPLLDRILQRIRADTDARRRRRAPQLVEALARAAPKPPPFEACLRRAPAPRIVARLERKNPLRRLFAAGLDAKTAAAAWEAGGAAALAAWTEGPFFAGSPDDLPQLRRGSRLPVLACDFVVDTCQLAEARAAGASAVLLHEAAAGSALGKLLLAARGFGLETVVEAGDEASLDRVLDTGAAMVCIASRDPRTFAADAEAAVRLAPRAARSGVLVLAADAVEDAAAVRRLSDAGVDAFLAGAPVVDAADRAAAVRALRGQQ